MGMSEFYGAREDTESMEVMHRAVDLGIDFFDTADIYGPHHNEELIARFLKDSGAKIKLASKFGIVRKPGEYARTINNTPEYLQQACEASLKRLGVEHIDLYYAHRINPEQPIEEMMQALSKLVDSGKIGHIGLCEVSAATLRRAHAVHPVSAVQTEYSLWERGVEEQILPTCDELGVGFVPYSPLGRGYLTGTYSADTQYENGDFRASLPRFTAENLVKNKPIVDVIEAVAESNDCTAAQVAIAWLLSKGDNIVPIPGTKRVSYLEQNVAAAQAELSASDIEKLDRASAEIKVSGERYTPEGMKGLGA